MHGVPGILTEAINTIAERLLLAVPHTLLLAVIFDEIAIGEHVEFVGSKFRGYVDLDPNFESSDVPAKEALVFVVVCVNDGWKTPA